MIKKPVPLMIALLWFLSLNTASGEAPSINGEGVRLVIEGEEIALDHCPEDHNFYNPVSSGLRAWAKDGGAEQFSITFLSLNLKKFEFPADLPPVREPGKPVDMSMLMASVGFSYVNPDGVEWAGPAKVNISSFREDGVLEGSFGETSLPQVDKAAPPIVLSEGKFKVRLQ
jgi:hypothetical protein